MLRAVVDSRMWGILFGILESQLTPVFDRPSWRKAQVARFSSWRHFLWVPHYCPCRMKQCVVISRLNPKGFRVANGGTIMRYTEGDYLDSKIFKVGSIEREIGSRRRRLVGWRGVEAEQSFSVAHRKCHQRLTRGAMSSHCTFESHSQTKTSSESIFEIRDPFMLGNYRIFNFRDVPIIYLSNRGNIYRSRQVLVRAHKRARVRSFQLSTGVCVLKNRTSDSCAAFN